MDGAPGATPSPNSETRQGGGSAPLDVAERGLAAQPASGLDALSETRSLSTRDWAAMLVVVDLSFAALATAAALVLRFGQPSTSVRGFPYAALVLVLPPIWVFLLAATGAYDRRVLGYGPEEYQRIGNAGLWLLLAYAAAALAFQADISRNIAAVSVVLTTLGTITGRLMARKRLHYRLRNGWALHKAVLLGPAHGAVSLANHMRRAPYSGFKVVAVCPTDPYEQPTGLGVPEFAYDEDIAARVVAYGADTLAVTSTEALPKGELRRLSWRLEGTGVQLIVAPSLTDFAGPRIVVRPVAGLPLLHIDEPELTGVRRAAKAVLDRAVASFLLVGLSPLLAATAILIWLGDRRSPFFTQDRIGRDGQEFRMWKFRTMRPLAEAEREALLGNNDHDGVLFKMRADPRVTPIGRGLRRHSIDELPQLWNVLRGEMSLVGPRPALPDEVAVYGDGVRRRLKVKPGMTGLWQISGRADLSWDESVRLDLEYVENWSVALDLMVIWKTVPVVVRGQGGY
jgi:exopolysaccharide biosynthesis polyprenyl glycosylphosphotransferase